MRSFLVFFGVVLILPSLAGRLVFVFLEAMRGGPMPVLAWLGLLALVASALWPKPKDAA